MYVGGSQDPLRVKPREMLLGDDRRCHPQRFSGDSLQQRHVNVMELQLTCSQCVLFLDKVQLTTVGMGAILGRRMIG